MSTETNPRLQVCPEITRSLNEIASLVEPDNYLGKFNRVPPGSHFRLIVETEVGDQYFIFRRSGTNEGRWYDWRMYAKEGGSPVERPVVLYGAVIEDGTIDMESIQKGKGFLLAEVELYPLGEPALEGTTLIAPGILATRIMNLGIIKEAIGIPPPETLQ